VTDLDLRGEDAFGIAGAVWTRTSLELPVDVTYDDWEHLCWAVGRITDQAKWALADLLLFGEARWGERYAQGAEATGRSVGGLRNIASVGSRVARDVRRAELSFGHHEEVAALSREEQIAWLDRAEEDRLTRDELRAHVRATRPERNAALRGSEPPTDHQPSRGAVSPPPAVEAKAPPLSPLPTPCETAWEDVLAAVAAAKKARADGGDWTAALRRLRVEVENAVECDQLVVVESEPGKPPWA
jgi:hypothetical protein